MKKKRCIAIIPARANSKRIKNKNIKKFFSKPIIYYPIQAAKKSKCFDKIFVSTDSNKIANISKKYGAEVPYTRPKNIADDKTSTSVVISHFIKFLLKKGEKFDYVCCIYPTAVFANSKNLIYAFKNIKKKNINYVFTVSEFNHPIERSFSLIGNKISKTMKKKFFLSRTNELKKRYHDAGQFYFGKTSSFLKKYPIFQKNCMVIKMKKNFHIDINDISDWKLAELMFKNI